MGLPFFIARRYIFSKKSCNAVQLISLITILLISLTVTVMVCVLSVFNGFSELLLKLFSSFDPDLKIILVTGKVFDPTMGAFLPLYRIPEIETVSETLDEQVLLVCQNRQILVKMKGVTDNFKKIISKRRILVEGNFKLGRNDGGLCAILGIGVANILGVNTDYTLPLSIYAIKKNSRPDCFFNPVSMFNRELVTVSGVFIMNQPVYDENYIIVSIDLARRLLGYKNEVSALEIKLKYLSDIVSVKKQIQCMLPDNKYLVKDRYEQQQTVFNMICVEKWITFLLLCFILLIVAFNFVGSLSVLLVDKQKDIWVFRCIGATTKQIAHIFILEGLLIVFIGCSVGILSGILLCFGQQYFKWFLIRRIQGAFAYPVRIEVTDILCVVLLVLTIGLVMVLYPVLYRIKNKK